MKAALAAANPILGTWKLQSLAYEVSATGQRSSPFGVAEDRPKPRDLVPTDEEKVNLQGSMFAYAGTYTADGEKVVPHVDISWNQSWTRTDLVPFYKLDGNTLTITTARAQSAFDGEEGEVHSSDHPDGYLSYSPDGRMYAIGCGKKYSRKHKTMQVDAATLAQLIHDGAKLALIFADRGARSLRLRRRSRCKIGSAQQKETEGVDQLWTRILKLAVLRLSGRA